MCLNGVINPEGFSQFWAAFPRKVGKLAAIKEWNKLNVDPQFEAEILAGVERYKRTKPAYADWCHPRTWLSQGRWTDQVEPVVTTQAATMSGAWNGELASWIRECTHEPRCQSSTEHAARVTPTKAGR